MVILFRLTPKILEMAGYRKMPVHVSSKRNMDESWITQSSWAKNSYPRFHLTKTDGIWDLHYDHWEKGHDTHSSEGKSQHCRNERARLKKLSLVYVYPKLAK